MIRKPLFGRIDTFIEVGTTCNFPKENGPLNYFIKLYSFLLRNLLNENDSFTFFFFFKEPLAMIKKGKYVREKKKRSCEHFRNCYEFEAETQFYKYLTFLEEKGMHKEVFVLRYRSIRVCDEIYHVYI